MKKQKVIIAIVTCAMVGIFLLPAGGQNKPASGQDKPATGQEKRENTFSAKGYLVDIACAAVHSSDRDGSWGVTHSRRCLQSEESAKSGFALLMPNGKIYRFDAAGNQMARKAIASTKKDQDVQIEVNGDLVDNDLRVKVLSLVK